MPRNISINITQDEYVALDALVAHDPLLNRHAVARLGLRLGLMTLAQEPGRIPELLRGHGVRVVPEQAGGVR